MLKMLGNDFLMSSPVYDQKKNPANNEEVMQINSICDHTCIM